jgi:hypothetical protein
MNITWTDVWTLVATTGLLTTSLNLVVSGLRERWTNQRQAKTEATYLAMRLSIILEEFVDECHYNVLGDECEFGRGAVELEGSLPALTCYPADSDWKSLDTKLAEQVLAFRNDVKSAKMSCQFESWHLNIRVGSAAEAIRVGAKASKLAQALRRKYKLEARHSEAAVCLEKKDADRQ